jgi:protein SCO1
MKNKLAMIVTGILLGLALTLAGWRVFAENYQYQGSMIDPPLPAANFQLTDQDNQPFSLNDHQGKVVLLFFGYSNCQDICPITLANYRAIKQRLGNLSGKVDFVFVTVDPEHDTVPVLRSYLAKFDPTFIGLTGSASDLEKVWKSFGVYNARVGSGAQLDQMIDHEARVYAIDAKGNLRMTFPYGMEVDKITQDVQHLTLEN